MMVLLELFLITSLLRKFETVPDLSDGWMRRHVDKAGGSWFWATRLWWRDDDNPGRNQTGIGRDLDKKFL